MNENEDQASIAQQQHDTLKSIEDDFIMVRVKQDITIVPLCEYIQESIKGALEAITNPPGS